MTLTARELWTVIHGILLGSVFLLIFVGALAELINLRPGLSSEAGIIQRVRRLIIGTWIMAAVAWLAVITGTYIVYPWYHAKPTAGVDLIMFPRSYLLAKPNLAGWHTFGMEWKENVAWLAPILATAVAYIVTCYGTRLAEDNQIRRGVMVLSTIAFVTAVVAHLIGAFINQIAPIH